MLNDNQEDNMIFTKFKSFLDFPYDKLYKEEIDAKLAEDEYHASIVLISIVLFMQILMVLMFLFKPEGPFATPRRSCYFLLYLSLISVSFIFLLLRKKFRNNRSSSRLCMGSLYAWFICLWACCVTFLDQLGGNGLIVFCYMLPTVAALTILTVRQGAVIYITSCIVLNIVLPFLPNGIHNMFSNLVNSSFITLLCIIITWRLYSAKVSDYYGTIIIKEQCQEIEHSNQILKETNNQLDKAAITDQLTNMHNRRYLDHIIQKRLEDPDILGCSIACFMIDIDYFKKYNDIYGHQAGDQCLKEVAKEILLFSQPDNIYAVRYGGEEFFIFWLDCDEETAQKGAEELRASIEAHQDITISIGLCIQHPNGHTTIAEFVYAADKALYEAKAKGRNCCVVYDHV